MTAPEKTPRHPPWPDRESTNKHLSENSYIQGWLPCSPGKLGWGVGQKDWETEEAGHVSIQRIPGLTHHTLWEQGRPCSMLQKITYVHHLPSPSSASQVLPTCQSSNRAPGPRCWEQESTWRKRQGSGDMGGYRCPCQKLGAGGPECPWEMGQEKGGQ